MRTRDALVQAAALLALACVTPDGYRHAAVPGVTIVPAPEDGVVGTAHRLEADAGASDDQLVQAFLSDAQKKGASRVGGLTLYDVAEQDGVARTCSRAFEPVGIEHTALEAQQRWSPPQSRVVMRLVSRTEPQMENRCHMVSRTVMRSETYSTQQYDAISKSSRSVMQTRMVPHQEMQQECRMETVWRTVSRMEPMVEWYQPPSQLVWVPVTHTRWELVADPPVCDETAGAKPARWVDGMLYLDEAK